MKKRIGYAAATAGGILLAAAGLMLLRAGTPSWMAALPYVAIGIGCGLFGCGVSSWINARVLQSRPDLKKQLEIEQNDERNTAIQNKARAISGDITMLAVLLAAMFFQAFEGPEIPGWIIWFLFGIVIGNLLLSLALHRWLQRKM